MKEFDFNDPEFDNEINSAMGTDEKPKSRIVLIVAIIMTITLVAIAVLAGYSMYRNDNPPSIKTVHIESDNFDNHMIAKYGNTITLTFTFSEEIQGIPKVIIMDRNVEATRQGKTFVAKYFVENQTNEDQIVTFSIHDYRDEYSKTGAPITETTDLSRVTIVAFK